MCIADRRNASSLILFRSVCFLVTLITEASVLGILNKNKITNVGFFKR